MQCPHCGGQRSKVMLTRDDATGVYRRRSCLLCFRNFVSLETAPAGLKLPRSIENRSRATEPKKKPGQARFETDHLKGFL